MFSPFESVTRLRASSLPSTRDRAICACSQRPHGPLQKQWKETQLALEHTQEVTQVTLTAIEVQLLPISQVSLVMHKKTHNHIDFPPIILDHFQL